MSTLISDQSPNAIWRLTTVIQYSALDSHSHSGPISHSSGVATEAVASHSLLSHLSPHFLQGLVKFKGEYKPAIISVSNDTESLSSAALDPLNVPCPKAPPLAKTCTSPSHRHKASHPTAASNRPCFSSTPPVYRRYQFLTPADVNCIPASPALYLSLSLAPAHLALTA